MFRKIAVHLTGFILCSAIALTSIVYFNSKNQPESLDNNSAGELYNDLISTQTDNPNITAEDYDPLSQITSNMPRDEEALDLTEYKYDDEIAKFSSYDTLKNEGYSLSTADYDPETSKLAIISPNADTPKSYSEKKCSGYTVVTEAGEKGGTVSHTEKKEEDAPVLLPYYSYIIYTSKAKTQLLDAQGKVLISSFGGYEPAYLTTLSGEPLFKKDSKYYYYCNPKTSQEIFFNEIDDTEYPTLSAKEPSASKYFDYDYILTLNDLTAGSNKRNIIPDISLSLPSSPSMLEYTVIEGTHKGLTTSAYTREKNPADLYPFFTCQYSPDFKIEKILWGYMNSKGETVIEPQFRAAYDFCEEGYAVVENIHSHLCIIDKKGKEVYNPYNEPVYLPELGGGYARTIFYLPDTYGEESTGIFSFSEGYTRMWRKLVDTTQGNSLSTYGVKNETHIIISAKGAAVNYPADYKLISYSNGILLLEKNGLYGYMNTDSEWIVKPVLKYAQPFSQGLAVMGYRTDKLGVIDTKGNVVIPHMFNNIENCSGGVISAFSEENGWVIFNTVSKEKAEKFINPVIALKQRAIAKAKYEYYTTKQAKEQGE